MSRIGYVRCSTVDQNPDRQKEILKKSGCDKVFVDMMSGKDTNRPGLQAMLEYIREGDEVYVESISRLARSTKDLLSIVDELNKKNVQFISQKESIDTATPQGKFMLTVFGAMAELERDQIRQRQSEGIAIAKAKGKYKGKQKKNYDHYLFEQLYKDWRNGVITQKYMCKRLDVSRSTLARIIRQKKTSENKN